MKSVILPEKCYKYINHTLKSVKSALDGKYAITCIPKHIDRRRKEVIVQLGKDLFGYLPYEEVTIYRLFKIHSISKNVPVQIIDIMDKTIRAKVMKIEDDRIILSRRANMLEAFEYLKNCSLVRINITRMSWSKVYGDIGEGVIGSMDISEICNAKIRNVKEQFKVDDVLWLKVQSIQDNFTLFLSYKERFAKYNPDDYEVGSLIPCVVTLPVNDPITGYFAIVTPQVRGIINVKPEAPFLQYGSRIIARIIGKTEKGLKLKFVHFQNYNKKGTEQTEETEEEQEQDE